jgi:hypothetical protein
MTIIEKYNNFWAVYYQNNIEKKLVCVAVYKKGAVAVKQILDTLLRLKGGLI